MSGSFLNDVILWEGEDGLIDKGGSWEGNIREVIGDWQGDWGGDWNDWICFNG
jgi:hypothetical protein